VTENAKESVRYVPVPTDKPLILEARIRCPDCKEQRTSGLTLVGDQELIVCRSCGHASLVSLQPIQLIVEPKSEEGKRDDAMYEPQPTLEPQPKLKPWFARFVDERARERLPKVKPTFEPQPKVAFDEKLSSLRIKDTGRFKG
jgi:hypothetical protein